ncbi:hypothetical protein PROFUN_02480 [Planoprotostelium fungivorum]|uniref:Uncharacterized protein n=1 Tax=Planoprotostelium fungivorum TaxID=1890364 RepID=A0A2P6MP47_9EUKA|nr:hypothetical protein PROFUN_02480 [Planoprotostelium fungivorum]
MWLGSQTLVTILLADKFLQLGNDAASIQQISCGYKGQGFSDTRARNQHAECSAGEW